MNRKKVKIGFIGCGAIGSRLAMSVKKELHHTCVICGVYDVDSKKVQSLIQSLRLPKKLIKKSIDELVLSCDFIVEAIASEKTTQIIHKVVSAKKNILIMSVGKVLNNPNILKLAQKNHTYVLIPSGAISGVDVIKSMGLDNISHITLTTRKPPSGIEQSDFLIKKGINLKNIKKETILFEGCVDDAVKFFPRNINVAATIALALGTKQKIIVRIITSPNFRSNSHEIDVFGTFGRLKSLTDNVCCPDNPKTSSLSIFSAVQALKQYFSSIKIGT